MKIIIKTSVLILVALAISSMADASNFKIIDSQKSITRYKALITNSIVVDPTVDSATLKQVLDDSVKETADALRSYSQPVKQIAVYAYLSETAYKQDKASNVGRAFWTYGEGNTKIEIEEDKLASAHQEQVKQGKKEEPYEGVFGPDGNFRTKAILLLEKQVYDALKREFELNPEPPLNKFVSNDAWVDACDMVEATCINKVATDFHLSEKTVKDIWFKVNEFKH